MFTMNYKKTLFTAVAIAVLSIALPSMAQQTIKIGASAPKTGPLA